MFLGRLRIHVSSEKRVEPRRIRALAESPGTPLQRRRRVRDADDGGQRHVRRERVHRDGAAGAGGHFRGRHSRHVRRHGVRRVRGRAGEPEPRPRLVPRGLRGQQPVDRVQQPAEVQVGQRERRQRREDDENDAGRGSDRVPRPGRAVRRVREADARRRRLPRALGRVRPHQPGQGHGRQELSDLHRRKEVLYLRHVRRQHDSVQHRRDPHRRNRSHRLYTVTQPTGGQTRRRC